MAARGINMLKDKMINLGFGICLLLFTISAVAKKMPDLYQAQVNISDRSQKNWQSGIKMGLSQVFVKVSGNNQVATIPQVRESLDHAEKFVESFGYKNKQSKLFLAADFSEKQVRKVLREARQSLWDEDRPETIMWFSRKAHNAAPEIVSFSSSPNLSQVIYQHAIRRGIPVQLPKLDPKDLSQISAQEMGLLNKFALERASERYDTEAVLGVRISQNIDDEWEAQCRLLVNGQTIEWHDQADSEEGILGHVVDRLASELAEEVLALKYHASQERVDVEIKGINGLEDYVAAVEFIKHLLPVTDVEVLGVKADVLQLNVLSGGGVSGLSEAITHAKHKKLEIGSEVDVYNRNLLKYRWVNRGEKTPRNEYLSNNEGTRGTSDYHRLQAQVSAAKQDENAELLENYTDKKIGDHLRLKIQDNNVRLR